MQHIWKSTSVNQSPAAEFGTERRVAPAGQATAHIRKSVKTRAVMGSVLLALAPAVIGSVYFFGAAALLYYIIAIAAALFADAVVQLIRRKQIDTFDASPIVTGTILTMALPMGAPLWLPVLGSFLAIWVAKEPFGGLGKNFLNPALFGWAMLRMLFPGIMTQNPSPQPLFGAVTMPDGVASATTLMLLKEGQTLTGDQLINSLLGLTPGKLGVTSALLLIVGGVWLIGRRVIRPRIPLAFLSSIAFMAFALGGPSGPFSGNWQTVLGHLLSGATMLGAFFIITDYSSSPNAPVPQYIFGVLCGVGTVLFRLYGPWAEGLTFAVLLSNLTVPLFNRAARPATQRKEKKIKTTA